MDASTQAAKLWIKVYVKVMAKHGTDHAKSSANVAVAAFMQSYHANVFNHTQYIPKKA